MTEVLKVSSKDDLSYICKNIASSVWSKNSEIDPRDYSVENLSKCISNQQHVFCIASHDKEFAGMASAFLMPKPDGGVWLYVDEIDVCAHTQQQGVGTAMMEFLIQYAKEKGCSEVWLGTETDNTPANALYQSLSPSKTENFVGYTFKV